MERRIAVPVTRLLNEFKVHELLYGEPAYCLPQFYTGYGDAHTRDPDLKHFITSEMRADWEANRDDLLRVYAGEITEPEAFGVHPVVWAVPHRTHPLPWAATVFDDE